MKITLIDWMNELTEFKEGVAKCLQFKGVVQQFGK